MSAKTTFQVFLEEEVNKVKGVYYPVKAGFLRRVFVKKTAVRKLHPNPNDEFCFPEIGPNYSIISDYEKDYREIKRNPDAITYIQSSAREPIMVERTKPDGYMILNGHHRWAAAYKTGLKKMLIKIVDLTQEKDIREMLRSSTNTRRVTLDLDEVVFCAANDPCAEKPLSFPQNRFYKERIRRGIPALFHALYRQEYDIWIYTAQYYSLEYLRHYFKHYHVPVTGIVTGTSRKGPAGTDPRKELEKMVEDRYKSTVHIDNELILCTNKGTKEFEEYRLSGSPETWSREVTEVLDKRKQQLT